MYDYKRKDEIWNDCARRNCCDTNQGKDDKNLIKVVWKKLLKRISW